VSGTEAAVRRARSEDARGIEEVRAASWRAAYGHLLAEDVFDNWDFDHFAARRAQLIQRGKQFAVVEAHPPPGLAGFISYGPGRDPDRTYSAEIFALYARPSHWSCGVGRVLMQFALAALQQHGFRTVSLWVLADNPRGRAFYAKAGFEPDGTVKNAAMPGDVTLPEVRLCRSITGP
jgi:GNAT superfamily N-acetyltransferase